LTVLQRLENGEANVAARVGYSVAIGEHLAAAGPGARLAELGHATRAALADVAGWRVVEPVGEPTAITTLTPLDGADPQKVRSWLIAERGDRHHIRRGAGGGDGTTAVITAKSGRSASPKG
jgi:pyridoxal 5-phosphate dependent beta-lyase